MHPKKPNWQEANQLNVYKQGWVMVLSQVPQVHEWGFFCNRNNIIRVCMGILAIILLLSEAPKKQRYLELKLARIMLKSEEHTINKTRRQGVILLCIFNAIYNIIFCYAWCTCGATSYPE